MTVASRALGSKYELISPLGSGAMGEVWRARDRVTSEPVAAKVLRSELSHNQEIISRFVRERTILTGLAHPGIVRVRDLVVEGDELAIVMDLVEGSDLRQVLRESGTLPPSLAAGLVARVLDALAEAHAQGALHRDVKPDNVLLTQQWRTLEEGEVRLSDFSIARLAQESTVQATGLLGTPEYMPPELFAHGTTSAASDVYAAGVLLYELLAGRTPYAGPGTAFTIGNRAVTVQPPELPVAPELWALVSALLAKDPRQRPRAVDAAEELRRRATALEGVPALPVQPTPTTWSPSGEADLTAGPIRTAEEDPGVDVGRTNLDVVFAPEEARAGQGEVVALAPHMTGLGLEAGVTNLGVAAPAYAAPVLQPAVEAPDAPSRRRPWLLVLAGILGVLLVAGVVVALTRGGGHGSADAPGSGASAAKATLDDTKVAGTGLQVRRSASYDPARHRVTLTFSFAADRVALRGPFLQVLPRSRGESDCPLASWEGAQVVPNDTMSTGISTPCAYRLTVPTLQPGTAQEVSATLPLRLPGKDPEAELGRWLSSTQQATDAALRGAQATNPSYAAQRLVDVEVTAPVSATVRSGEIPIRIFPVWSEGVDRLHPLFDSKSAASTNLLDQVAGGLAGVRLFDDCHGALIVDRRSVTVLRPSASCAVLANVGNLTDRRSNEFQISGSAS